MAEKFKLIGVFLRFLVHNYYEDRCLRSASALCYTTLLSLVPLTAVVFSVFAAFPVFQNVATDIQAFVFQNFVPASGEVVQTYLQQFADKASNLTAIGIAFLILSALLLMNTIDGALNDIWYVTTPRKAAPKFMVYWAVLTLGPVLMGASIATTSYLTSLPFITDTAILSEMKTHLLGLLPFFATLLACTLLYAIVPNTPVPLRHAISGALVAAILFELAKKGFALYVTTFPTYQLVYGALATIPVFLVWVYLSWMVILLGAEVTYCLTHFHVNFKQSEAPAGLRLLHDFQIVGLIWRAQRDGIPPTEAQLFSSSTGLDEASVTEALVRLEGAGIIHRSYTEQWAMTKDMSVLTLADLLRAESRDLPQLDPRWAAGDEWSQRVFKILAGAHGRAEQALGLPLQPLYERVAPNTMEQGEDDVKLVTVTRKPAEPEGKNQRIEPTIRL